MLTTDNKAPDGKATLLFIDDEKPVLMSLRALLRVKYNVLCAHSAQEALPLLAQGGVDVIICDQRMPGTLGTDLLREAQRLAPTAIRIMLTGYADRAALLEAVNDCEVFRLVMKPWNNEQLMEMLTIAADSARGGSGKFSGPGPRTGQFPVVPGMATERPAAGRPGVLLLSEDSRLSKAVVNSLKGLEAGTPIVHETTLDAAVNRLGDQEVAVFVVDINTKREEKLELFYALKRLHPLVHGIAVARDVDVNALIKLVNMGRIYRYLALPVEDAAMLHSVKSALQSYSQSRSQPILLLRQKPDAAPAMRDMTLMQKLLAKATVWRRTYYKAV